MKKYLVIIILMSIYLSNIYSQNLLQNPGFENHNSGTYGENPFYDGEIGNWYSAQGTPQARTNDNYIYNVYPHSGEVVPYMVAEYVEYKDGFTHYCSEGIFQNIGLDGCKLYELSFWVRNPSTNITLTDFYVIAANGLQNNSEFACNVPPNISDTMIIYHGKNLAPGGWYKITTSFIPNKYYNQLWIYPRQTVYHYYSSELTVDDISITEKKISALNGNVICYSGNYSFSLSNLPTNPAIYWTHSNNLTYVSGQGTSFYKVRAKYSSTSGQGWIKANVSYNGCSLSFTKQVWIGKPNFTLTGDYVLAPREMGIAEVNYAFSPGQGITSYNWNRSGAISRVSGSTVLGKYWAGTRSGSGTVDLTLTNQCGSMFKYFIVRVTGGWHKAFPNPANDILTIEIDENKMPKSLKSKEIKIRILDKMMRLKKVIAFSGISTTIDVSDFKPDVYFLQIEINNEIFEDKIIVSE